MILHVGFTPQGDWFIFTAEGKTLHRGFRSRRVAESRAYLLMFPNARLTP